MKVNEIFQIYLIFQNLTQEETMKIIVAIVALQAVFVGGIVSDYCLVSQERCDKDGIYKYKWITSYQDFIIRDKLDSELENIKKDPWLALQRSQQTVETNPNRWVQLCSHGNKIGLIVQRLTLLVKGEGYVIPCIAEMVTLYFHIDYILFNFCQA